MAMSDVSRTGVPLSTNFQNGVKVVSPRLSACEPGSAVVPVVDTAGLSSVAIPGVSGNNVVDISPVARGITAEGADEQVLRMVYGGLCDGSLDVHLPVWRKTLMKLLVRNVRGVDFDTVFTLLIENFTGHDIEAKLVNLEKWAEGLPAEISGDVWRAETRYRIHSGEYRQAIDAANRMEAARPDYCIRACRLRAMAMASDGDLESAMNEIGRARSHQLPEYEACELLYLEAWIEMQRGEDAVAIRILRSLVARAPGSGSAQKAVSILEAIGGAEK